MDEKGLTKFVFVHMSHITGRESLVLNYSIMIYIFRVVEIFTVKTLHIIEYMNKNDKSWYKNMSALLKIYKDYKSTY